MRGFEVVDGGGEVGDNMHGWASVGHGVDICLNYNTAHSKKDKKKEKRKKKEKQTNKIQEDEEGEPRNRRSQYKIRCIIVLIVLKTN